MRTRSSGFWNPLGSIRTTSTDPVILWFDAKGERRSATATSKIKPVALHTNEPCRRPATFAGRRNYQGHYWMSQTGHHVWHESMVEYSALMSIDHSLHIRGVAAQPFCILFPDNSRHFPDFFSLSGDWTQTVWDVRPAAKIDMETREIFLKTREICRSIGWDYQIVTELPLTARFNLELLARYRHTYDRPTDELESEVFGILDRPRSFAELDRLAGASRKWQLRPALYNLMWRRVLSFDLFDGPFSGLTTLCIAEESGVRDEPARIA
jgi:hypothetical protein